MISLPNRRSPQPKRGEKTLGKPSKLPPPKGAWVALLPPIPPLSILPLSKLLLLLYFPFGLLLIFCPLISCFCLFSFWRFGAPALDLLQMFVVHFNLWFVDRQWSWVTASGALYLGRGGNVDVGWISINCYAGLFCVVETTTLKHHCRHDIVAALAHKIKDLVALQILELQNWELSDCVGWGLAGMALWVSSNVREDVEWWFCFFIYFSLMILKNSLGLCFLVFGFQNRFTVFAVEQWSCIVSLSTCASGFWIEDSSHYGLGIILSESNKHVVVFRHWKYCTHILHYGCFVLCYVSSIITISSSRGKNNMCFSKSLILLSIL